MSLPWQTRVRLLDLVPDLGADLPDEARDDIVTPLVVVPAGPWDPTQLALNESVRGRLFAGVVAKGLIVREIQLAGRASTECFGPGDLIGADRLASRALSVETVYEAASEAEIALLDDHFLRACQHYPRVIGRLIDMAAEQLGRTAIHQAIAQLPRVEARLLALFRHLADRWGHTSNGGIVVDLPLTHEAIGKLIGARRPTVSLGLTALAAEGLVHRREDGCWVLDPDSSERVAAA